MKETDYNSVKECLIEKLTKNRIGHSELNTLMKMATTDDLKTITQSVFDMNEATLIERSTVEGATQWLNSIKNEHRKELYVKKIQHPPHNDLKKVVAQKTHFLSLPARDMDLPRNATTIVALAQYMASIQFVGYSHSLPNRHYRKYPFRATSQRDFSPFSGPRYRYSFKMGMCGFCTFKSFGGVHWT